MTTHTDDAAMNLILRTYRGRPGCGCGCRGRYAEPNETRKVKNDVRDVVAAVVDGTAIISINVVASENESRFVWIFFESNDGAEAFVAFHAGRAAVDAAKSRSDDPSGENERDIAARIRSGPSAGNGDPK